MDQRTIRLRQAIKAQFDDKQEYVDVRPGNLGNEAYLVEVPGRPNYVYVREVNGGAVVQAFNARVASVWNLPVYIGFSNEMPDILQVIQQRSIPTTTGSGMTESPAVASHAETHIWPYGTDIIYPWKSQIRDGRVDGIAPVSGSYLPVKIQRNRIFVSGSVIYAPEQVIDLFPYVPVTSNTARWVTLSTGSSGVVEVTQSSAFASTEWALATIPLVPSNNAPNAAVRLYNGQTIIFQGIAGTDVQDLRWLEPGSGIAERYAPSNGPYVLTSSDSALPSASILTGSSPIYTDGSGLVGINYDSTLTLVSGSLHAVHASGSVATDATLTGDGTSGSPLGVVEGVISGSGPVAVTGSGSAVGSALNFKLVNSGGSTLTAFDAGALANSDTVVPTSQAVVTTLASYLKLDASNSPVTGQLLVGTSASAADFANAQLITSKGDSGHTYTYNIGLVGEAAAAVGQPSIGVGGVARTNGYFPGYGVAGRAKANTGDAAGAIGVEGLSEDTHAGGANIAFYASATNGLLNYSFFGNSGSMYNVGSGSFGGPLSASNLSGTNTGDQINISGSSGSAAWADTLDGYHAAEFVAVSNFWIDGGSFADIYTGVSFDVDGGAF